MRKKHITFEEYNKKMKDLSGISLISGIRL